MIYSITRKNPATLALLTIVATVFAYEVIGNRTAPAAPPAAPTPSNPAPATAVATFDLEKSFNALHEKKSADAELLKLAEAMNTKGEEQSKAIKQMQKDLQDHQEGAPKWRELNEKIAQATLDYRAYVEFCKAKIDIQRARTLKKIYLHIRESVKKLAEERGIDVVYVDDSIAEIPPGNEEETNRQISARRIVYRNPKVDITEELISRMNQSFLDAGGVVPPPPTPAAPSSTNKPSAAAAPAKSKDTATAHAGDGNTPDVAGKKP